MLLQVELDILHSVSYSILSLFVYRLDCWLSVQDYGTHKVTHTADFGPENVFTDECDDEKKGNYWMLPDRVVEDGFILDRHCTEPFDTILLKNTHNGNGDDR